MTASKTAQANHSIEFFDVQFRRPPDAAALALNPFERLALPHLRGEVLDFGCGLGNLAFAAAQAGCTVTALDASAAAVEHIRARARAEGVAFDVACADLRTYRISAAYDCIVSIGLLMFFDCPTALRVLAELQAQVRPGGVAVVNVLVQGTTYREMFDPTGHCLFAPSELRQRFAGWRVLHSDLSEFAAPGDTVKRFATLIARKPAPGDGARANRVD